MPALVGDSLGAATKVSDVLKISDVLMRGNFDTRMTLGV